MCRPLPRLSRTSYPEFYTPIGRAAGCFSKSWWLIANEFAEARLHPGTVLGVLAPVIHGYIQAEYPLFYEKAFFHWKWNMGFRTIVDDGYSLTAVYPFSPQWVSDFIKVRYWWTRDVDLQPNSCICCAQHQMCWDVPHDAPPPP